MASEILKEIKKSLIENGIGKTLANRVKFPDAIEIDEIIDKGKIVIKLSDKAIGMCEDGRSYSNMQNDDASFEGWALLIYSHYAKEKNYKIELDLKQTAYDNIEKIYKIKSADNYTNNRRHYNRFLYRALRFSQQYRNWFILSNELKPHVEAFNNYLSNSKIGFTNNIPNNIPNENKTSNQYFGTNKIHENDVEDIFANLNWQSNQGAAFCKKYGGVLYRQLPVGLFEGSEAIKAKAVFTGNKSAIDLWSCNNNELNVFELKFNNKMIGILTEIFFYANFMRDMFCKGKIISFKCQPSKEYRGYEHLAGASFTKVNGYMLIDEGKLHQAITKKVIGLMNKADFSDAPAFTISYDKIEYRVLSGCSGRTIEA